MVEDNNSQDLDLLSKKLVTAKARRTEKTPERVEDSATGIAMKIGIELAVSVAVVTYLGYLLDQWLDIAPGGVIVGFMLGFAAGLRNVFIAAKNMQGPVDTIDD
jgi:ATP synthase protein I